jgi:hypothetical protein
VLLPLRVRRGERRISNWGRIYSNNRPPMKSAGYEAASDESD